MAEGPTPRIYVDADACPVKQEVYRVAARHRLRVTLVANAPMQVPESKRITLHMVKAGLDAADDWIVESAGPGDLVVTADVPLASRCLKKGARVLSPSGKPFSEDNIGDAVATRDLLSDLRSAGEATGGPPPITKRDRSRFLHQLDEMIRAVLREPGRPRGIA